MIAWWQAVILGIVQGLTEFLPISSSGHLVLAQEFFAFEESMVAFDVLLHLGTLGAVLVYFWKDFFALRWKQIKMVAIGTLPLVLIAPFVLDVVDELFTSVLVVAFGLLISGVANITADRILQRKSDTTVEIETMGWKAALMVGLAQVIAIIPGISRSGSTVFAGLSAHLNRRAAFRFSFFLSVPAIAGASAVHLIDPALFGTISNVSVWSLVFGMIAAFGAGIASLRLLEYMIVAAKLRYFGWYCLTLSLAAFVYALI